VTVVAGIGTVVLGTELVVGPQSMGVVLVVGSAVVGDVVAGTELVLGGPCGAVVGAVLLPPGEPVLLGVVVVALVGGPLGSPLGGPPSVVVVAVVVVAVVGADGAAVFDPSGVPGHAVVVVVDPPGAGPGNVPGGLPGGPGRALARLVRRELVRVAVFVLAAAGVDAAGAPLAAAGVVVPLVVPVVVPVDDRWPSMRCSTCVTLLRVTVPSTCSLVLSVPLATATVLNALAAATGEEELGRRLSTRPTMTAITTSVAAMPSSERRRADPVFIEDLMTIGVLPWVAGGRRGLRGTTRRCRR
jgi:hypothetical protein